MMPPDHVLAGLQDKIDSEYAGWHVDHYVAVVGLERFGCNGNLERTFAVYMQDGQHDYITLGLLAKAFLTIADR